MHNKDAVCTKSPARLTIIIDVPLVLRKQVVVPEYVDLFFERLSDVNQERRGEFDSTIGIDNILQDAAREAMSYPNSQQVRLSSYRT